MKDALCNLSTHENVNSEVEASKKHPAIKLLQQILLQCRVSVNQTEQDKERYNQTRLHYYLYVRYS